VKRSALIILALLGVLFALVGVFKYNRRIDVEKEASRDSKDRQAVVRFWEAYHKATQLRSERRYGEAANLYAQALQQDPEHEESLYYLGNCLLELGEFKPAIETYRRLVQVNPRSHRGFSQLGVTLSALEPGSSPDYAGARKSFERVIEVDPEESGPLLRLGWLSLQEDRLEEAYGHFQKAAGFASPEGHYWSGFVRFQQQRYSEAIDHFVAIVSIAAHEKRIAGQGGRSEGDVAGTGAPALSPLKKAELKARLFLYWASQNAGGYPAEVEDSIRLAPPAVGTPERITLSPEPASNLLGRGAWGDFNGDGVPDLAISSGSSVTIYQYRNSGLAKTTELNVSRDSGTIWDLCTADFNRDGRDDLYVVRSGFWGSSQNRLLLSRGAPGSEASFIDSTEELGLIGERSTICALAVDLNDDGKDDILELGSSDHGPPLRIYLGSASRFQNATSEAKIAFEGIAVDAAIGDVDGDSDLDLYVLRWKRPGLLFQNEGDGTYSDVTKVAGLEGVGGRGYSTLFIDYDRDDNLDLLVTAQAPYEPAIAPGRN
jgi:tetratricopeptide (TPR) repeat protein